MAVPRPVIVTLTGALVLTAGAAAAYKSSTPSLSYQSAVAEPAEDCDICAARHKGASKSRETREQEGAKLRELFEESQKTTREP